MNLVGVRVERRIGPREELLKIQSGEQLEPAFIDRSFSRAARDIPQNVVDRIRREEDTLILPRTTLAAPIAGERIARLEITCMRRSRSGRGGGIVRRSRAARHGEQETSRNAGRTPRGSGSEPQGGEQPKILQGDDNF